nr:MAG TPA: hypothetical protein [Caudoviricetes sp.]
MLEDGKLIGFQIVNSRYYVIINMSMWKFMLN